MSSTSTTNGNKFGDFPKPAYNPKQIAKIPFQSFCQCQREEHTFNFQNSKGHDNDVDVAAVSRCNVSCYHYMAAVARACQYKNCLFTGDDTLFGSISFSTTTEICAFRQESSIEERTKWLKNLLQVANHLPDHYKKYENLYQEGAQMFSDRTSILTTIRILSLIQHYSDVFNNKDAIHSSNSNTNGPTKRPLIATPMIECTRDLRVAASMAVVQRSQKKPGVVRLLLVPSPRAIDAIDELDFGSQVQRLGEINILLVDVAAILPASAIRPLNQSGYMMIYEPDLLHFHEVRLSGRNLEEIMEVKAAQSLVNDNEPWDVLQSCHLLDIHIPKKGVTVDAFFHKTSRKGPNAFPALSIHDLYPEFDPMKEVMIQIAVLIRGGKAKKKKKTKKKRKKKYKVLVPIDSGNA